MKFVIGFLVGIVIIPVIVYCYFNFGYAPVATGSAPMPFEVKFARAAMHQRVQREYPRQIPFQASEAQLSDAAHQYRQHCAVCHGLPGQAKTPTATGMYPKPPQLFKGKGVTDDPAGETYWKVENGIRMTGMPAYKQSLSTEQMWSISEMLAGADKLPPSVTAVLNQPVREP